MRNRLGWHSAEGWRKAEVKNEFTIMGIARELSTLWTAVVGTRAP
jgi:hypothetical protein